tara:strand:- start:2770 stop:5244 length:2475 start_codon:yes stop_codon:yes gene_type:complete
MEEPEIIDFKGIEKKWQGRWEKEKAFEVSEESDKKKYYVLEQFPYPSGSGLHMGHAFIYTIGDIYARFKRLQGYNVLYPMGFDSFGLPAENAAIKAKSHPKKFTEDAIENFIKHYKRFGNSYDWTRMIETHKPDFYKWDQWIFLKMLEKGLAYRKKSAVNWCGKCNTVLANEQVHSGKCWRHEDTEVEIKQLSQWYLRITKYADELLEELDKIEWPELIKAMQRNWIGKSFGSEIDFEVNGSEWPVFTTRPDTLMGVTFLVVSAQHPRLMSLVTNDRKSEVDGFLARIKSTSDADIGELEKEGVFTGSYAIHPISGDKIQVWAGNFVVADYGSGMVMAVPAHDQRDYEFANKYGIEIREVVESDGSGKGNEAYVGEGKLINSGEFSGLESREAKGHITNALEAKGKGRKKTSYRLRDWLISRQRFWGTPIPIIYCDDCGAVPVPEKELPVKLPEDIEFKGVENPLKEDESFLKVECSKCGKEARRETDTMDTFANSSWYYLRYTDPKNKKEIFDSGKANYWNPIDVYVGGKEHATMHDIYFRFYHKFLRDLGLLKSDEPARALFNQGFVYGPDGRKMSKSYGNVVLPGEAADKFSVDSVRMFLMSVANPEKDFIWSDNGAESVFKFLIRVMNYFNSVKDRDGTSGSKIEHKINKGIREIGKNVESFNYNLAVIGLRQLFLAIESEEQVSVEDLQSFVKMLSLFCPHVAEECWEKLGGKGFVSLSGWPMFDEGKVDEEFDKAEEAVDKVVGDVLNILKIMSEKGSEGERVYLYVLPQELERYDSAEIKRRVNKEVAVYKVNDPNKVDPEGKAKKAKPGKPAIYIE